MAGGRAVEAEGRSGALPLRDQGQARGAEEGSVRAEDRGYLQMMRACPTCKRRHICGVKKKRPKKKDYGTKAILAAVFKRANGLCEFCPWIQPRYAHEL